MPVPREENFKVMKQIILTRLLILYATVLRLIRKIGLIKIIKSSAIILPAAEPGNLGDEALVASTINYLKQENINQIALISYNPKRQWGGLDTIPETIDMQGYFSQGSWQFWRSLFQFISKVIHYEKFYCLGADVMDGYYSPLMTAKVLKLITVAAATGVDTTIIGFSFNNQPTPDAVKSLRNLPLSARICARDPISQARLVKYLERPIELVADVAFLLEPVADSEAVLSICDWIEEQKKCDRITVGFNPYNQLTQEAGINNFEQLVQFYVATIISLHSKHQSLSFLFIPHDFRSYKNKYSDLTIIEAILKALPEEIICHSKHIANPCTAANIKAIVGKLDIILSGKFHLAIACLGQGNPPACLTYQGKFEGLFQHFELEGVAIAPPKAFETGSLADFLLPLIEKRQEISEHIRLKLPKVQQLAQNNFK